MEFKAHSTPSTALKTASRDNSTPSSQEIKILSPATTTHSTATKIEFKATSMP